MICVTFISLSTYVPPNTLNRGVVEDRLQVIVLLLVPEGAAVLLRAEDLLRHPVVDGERRVEDELRSEDTRGDGERRQRLVVGGHHDRSGHGWDDDGAVAGQLLLGWVGHDPEGARHRVGGGSDSGSSVVEQIEHRRPGS